MVSFGHVTAPPVDHRDIPADVNTAWDAAGQRHPEFVVLHRMEGTLAGTDTYFRTDARRAARTDYGLDNATGAIWRWTDPTGTITPWASGPWTSPPGDGIALVAKLGVEAINRDGISIEIGGAYGDPVSEVARARLVRLVAFWADWCEVPWQAWPVNPATGLTFVYWHAEFNGGKPCPGPVVKALTPTIIDEVRTVLRAAQTGPAGSSPTAPTPTVVPPGVNASDLAGWFGSVASADGGAAWAWNPSGSLSRLWLARGRAEGVWPALVAVTTSGPARTFRFADGWTVRADAAGHLTIVQDEQEESAT